MGILSGFSAKFNRAIDHVVGRLILRSELLAMVFYKSHLLKYIRVWLARIRLSRFVHSVLTAADHPPEEAIQLYFGKLKLDRKNVHDQLMYFILLNEGLYEGPIVDLMARMVHKGDVCADVGSNNAYFTLLLSFLVGETGKVISFEPSGYAYDRGRNNIALNKLSNIVPYRLALSDTTGPRVLFESTLEDGQNSLARIESAGLKQTINTIRLDELESATHIDFVKIDAEGWELPIFRGMSGLWERNRNIKVVMEYNLRAQIAAGFKPSDLMSAIAERGFSTFEIIGRNLELKSVESWHDLSSPLTNIFFLRDSDILREARSPIIAKESS